MKDKQHGGSSKANGQTQFPAKRITALLSSLKATLSAFEGRPLSYEALAVISSRPSNTLADWFVGGATHQLSALLCMLERLPPEARHRLLDECCRIHPTLTHARLAHDFHTVDSLSALAEKKSGITFIDGNPEHFRTFVTIALGNATIRNRSHPSPVAGIDIHPASEFVPVPGVTYLDQPIRSITSKTIVHRAWRIIQVAPAQCVILNGVLNLVTELLPEIANLSTSRHVVIADEADAVKDRAWRNAQGPIHLVTVSPTRHHPAWIQVHVKESW